MSQPSQAKQPSLFENIPERIHWLKDEIVFSLSFDQDKILRDIIRLYNSGMPFDVDPTYSKGVFWKKLPQPKMKFDIDPQYPDVVKASANNLPLDDASVQSIIFDPPFFPSRSKIPGKIKARFTAFNSVTEMWTMYRDSLKEFWRILKPGGIVTFKCQDTVSSGKNYFSHFEVEKYAHEIGYDQLDLFVLGSKRVLISSKWLRQQHARKNHSYIIVLSKPKIKRGKSG